MEEIEYLEEYEDLILPTISSSDDQLNVESRGFPSSGVVDESSMDDILESLFDEHTNILQRKADTNLSHRGNDERGSLDSLDLLYKDLVGEELLQNSSASTTNQEVIPAKVVYSQSDQPNIRVPATQATGPSFAQRSIQRSTSTASPYASTSSSSFTSSANFRERCTPAQLGRSLMTASSSSPGQRRSLSTMKVGGTQRIDRSKSVATVKPTLHRPSIGLSRGPYRSLASSSKQLPRRQPPKIKPNSGPVQRHSYPSKLVQQRPAQPIPKISSNHGKIIAEDPLSLDNLFATYDTDEESDLDSLSDFPHKDLDEYDDISSNGNNESDEKNAKIDKSLGNMDKIESAMANESGKIKSKVAEPAVETMRSQESCLSVTATENVNETTKTRVFAMPGAQKDVLASSTKGDYNKPSTQIKIPSPDICVANDTTNIGAFSQNKNLTSSPPLSKAVNSDKETLKLVTQEESSLLETRAVGESNVDIISSTVKNSLTSSENCSTEIITSPKLDQNRDKNPEKHESALPPREICKSTSLEQSDNVAIDSNTIKNVLPTSTDNPSLKDALIINQQQDKSNLSENITSIDDNVSCIQKASLKHATRKRPSKFNMGLKTAEVPSKSKKSKMSSTKSCQDEDDNLKEKNVPELSMEIFSPDKKNVNLSMVEQKTIENKKQSHSTMFCEDNSLEIENKKLLRRETPIVQEKPMGKACSIVKETPNTANTLKNQQSPIKKMATRYSRVALDCEEKSEHPPRRSKAKTIVQPITKESKNLESSVASSELDVDMQSSSWDTEKTKPEPENVKSKNTEPTPKGIEKMQEAIPKVDQPKPSEKLPFGSMEQRKFNLRTNPKSMSDKLISSPDSDTKLPQNFHDSTEEKKSKQKVQFKLDIPKAVPIYTSPEQKKSNTRSTTKLMSNDAQKSDKVSPATVLSQSSRCTDKLIELSEQRKSKSENVAKNIEMEIPKHSENRINITEQKKSKSRSKTNTGESTIPEVQESVSEFDAQKLTVKPKTQVEGTAKPYKLPSILRVSIAKLNDKTCMSTEHRRSNEKSSKKVISEEAINATNTDLSTPKDDKLMHYEKSNDPSVEQKKEKLHAKSVSFDTTNLEKEPRPLLQFAVTQKKHQAINKGKKQKRKSTLAHALLKTTNTADLIKIYKLRKIKIVLDKNVVTQYLKEIPQTRRKVKRNLEKAAMLSAITAKSMSADTSTNLSHDASKFNSKKTRTSKTAVEKGQTSNGENPINTGGTLSNTPPGELCQGQKVPTPLLRARTRNRSAKLITVSSDKTVILQEKTSPQIKVPTSGCASADNTSTTALDESQNELSLLTPIKTATIQVARKNTTKPPIPEFPLKSTKSKTVIPATVTTASTTTSNAMATPATVTPNPPTVVELKQENDKDYRLFEGDTFLPMPQTSVSTENGCRMYTFQTPMNKHCNGNGALLLDYCCPTIDGSLPNTDPNNWAASDGNIRTIIRELPSYIVMEAKIITHAELRANKNCIPAPVRQKIQKLHQLTAAEPAAEPSAQLTQKSTESPSGFLAGIAANSIPQLHQKAQPTPTAATPVELTKSLASIARSPKEKKEMYVICKHIDLLLKKHTTILPNMSMKERQQRLLQVTSNSSLTVKDAASAYAILQQYFDSPIMPETRKTQVSIKDKVPIMDKSQNIIGYQIGKEVRYAPYPKVNTAVKQSASSSSSNHAPAIVLTNNSSTSSAVAVTSTPTTRSFQNFTSARKTVPVGQSDSPRIFFTKAPHLSRNLTVKPVNSLPRSTYQELGVQNSLQKKSQLRSKETVTGTPSSSTLVTTAMSKQPILKKNTTKQTKAVQRLIIVTTKGQKSTNQQSRDEMIVPDDEPVSQRIKTEHSEEECITGGL